MKRPSFIVRASRKILVWDQLLLFCLPLDRDQRKEKARIDVRFEPGDRNRLEKLAGIRPDHLRELELGCLAVIGLIDDEPVYYAFVNPQAV
ncbi:hypothetical protein JW992_14665, partial [candidate division KSB1 bacterium]|nr:hypothetical protein [candidate division KSB1 bacterium]